MSSSTGNWRDRLTRFAERRLPALTRHRQAEALPIRLHARRIYILPTRFGVVFGVIVLAMLMGALNFNNNPAMLLSFFVASIATLSFHHTVGQLRGIELIAVRSERAHAGGSAFVHFCLREDHGNPRNALMLQQAQQEICFNLPANQTLQATVEIPALKRGWQTVGRWQLWSEYPFGIVWAWSYLHPQEPILIYPRAEADAPMLPRHDSDRPGAQYRPPGDDWVGLRDHRHGDAPRSVAWRASARSDRLMVKEFADPVAEAVVFDYAELGALDHEQRISRLAAWVLQAETQLLSYRLRLPGRELGPAAGPDFVSVCLRELALLP